MIPGAEVATAKAGWSIAKSVRSVWRWFGGVWTTQKRLALVQERLTLVEERLAELERARNAPADPRPVCKKCGKGHVGLTHQIRTHQVAKSYGACDGCGASWRISSKPVPMVLLRWETPNDEPDPPDTRGADLGRRYGQLDQG